MGAKYIAHPLIVSSENALRIMERRQWLIEYLLCAT